MTVSKYASKSVTPAVSIKRVNRNKNLAWHCVFSLRITEVEIFILTRVVELQSLEGLFKFRPASPLRLLYCFLIALSNLYLKCYTLSHFDQVILAVFQMREQGCIPPPDLG